MWHALIRKYKGLKVSNRRINKLAGKLGVHDPWDIPYDECVFQLRQACKEYKKFIPNVFSERQHFNESLAERNAKISNKKSVPF